MQTRTNCLTNYSKPFINASISSFVLNACKQIRMRSWFSFTVGLLLIEQFIYFLIHLKQQRAFQFSSYIFSNFGN